MPGKAWYAFIMIFHSCNHMIIQAKRVMIKEHKTNVSEESRKTSDAEHEQLKHENARLKVEIRKLKDSFQKRLHAELQIAKEEQARPKEEVEQLRSDRQAAGNARDLSAQSVPKPKALRPSSMLNRVVVQEEDVLYRQRTNLWQESEGLGHCITGNGETVATRMWKTLQDHGVDHVFGLPGGNVINFLRQKPAEIRWTNVGHEDFNGFVAQSYGVFRQVPGVLVTTHGPGAAAATNSLYNAVAEVKPLLHIHQFNDASPARVFQQWDVQTILSGITKLVYYLKHPKDTEHLTKTALEKAAQLRTTSVILVHNSLWPCCHLDESVPTSPSEYPQEKDLPKFTQSYVPETPPCLLGSAFRIGDVVTIHKPGTKVHSKKAVIQGCAQEGRRICLTAYEGFFGKIRSTQTRPAGCWDAANIREERVRKRKHPEISSGWSGKAVLDRPTVSQVLLVIAGSMTDQDRNRVAAFLERSSAAYVSTFKSRVQIPGNTNYYGRLGTLGDTTAHYALTHARHLIILNPEAGGLGHDSFYGMRFGVDHFLVDPSTTIVQISNAAALAELCFFNFPGINSQNKLLPEVGGLLESFHFTADPAWIGKLDSFKSQVGTIAIAKSMLEKYAKSAADVHRSLPDDQAPSVVTGVGNHWYAVGKYMDVRSPAHYYSPTNWGSIGVGIANGLGLHFATGRHVWVFEGDGGAIFSAGLFAYIFSHSYLKLTVTVFLDDVYAAVQASPYICAECRDASAPCSQNITIPQANDVQSHISTLLHDNGNTKVHRFSSPQTYRKFLTREPTSDHVRVVLLDIPRTSNGAESAIYEINVNSAYKHALETGDIERAKGLARQQILFEDEE